MRVDDQESSRLEKSSRNIDGAISNQYSKMKHPISAIAVVVILLVTENQCLEKCVKRY